MSEEPDHLVIGKDGTIRRYRPPIAPVDECYPAGMYPFRRQYDWGFKE